jgi:hypothetical protein
MSVACGVASREKSLLEVAPHRERMETLTYELVPALDTGGVVTGSSEYRRTHFRVYDENGFASTFETSPPESATIASVLAYVIEKFHGTGGTGYASKDLVVLLGARIVAVVRNGRDGNPEITQFEI